MGRKWIAALLAAVAVVPSAALAQDRGDRGAMRAERQAAREARQQAGGGPTGGITQQRPQQQGGWQRAERAPQQRAQGGGWTNRNEARQERRDDRRDFTAERQRDRQALAAGQVSREQYRADRTRDRSDFRRDQSQNRQALRGDWQQQRQWNDTRHRDDDRRWTRSGADWNDMYRFQGGDRWQGNRYGNGWNRDWRRDTRYDWNRWRGVNRNAFRLPRYYAPYGWNYGYRRFGIGATLSTMLFAQDYWIDDPWSYRLPEAYGPYRWVRYYNDAILVDTYTGEVADVINDIFW